MTGFGAFSGIRVIELTEGIAGPYAARFLADQSADVIKVERIEGDSYRSEPGFQVLNRNKRSVVVEDDTELLKTADVVIVSDAAEADRARSVAPGSVIVAMPTWGSAGPMTDESGSWQQVAAATGIAWNQVSWTEGPVHVVLPLASYGAGMLGALAVAAGLYAREAHGSAPTYEVSEVAGSGVMQIGDFWSPEIPKERDGASPLGPAGRAPAYRPFRTADNSWFFVACGTYRFYRSMLEAIERLDLLDDPRLPNPPWGLIEPDPL
ncbi:MAG: CoA transferase, partial [Actinomycetota bacterium]|nr:CoA transferase [Actinomycetota bacterium]